MRKDNTFQSKNDSSVMIRSFGVDQSQTHQNSDDYYSSINKGYSMTKSNAPKFQRQETALASSGQTRLNKKKLSRNDLNVTENKLSQS